MIHVSMKIATCSRSQNLNKTSTYRSSDTNFVLESGNRGGGASLLGRGKGGGRSGKSEERDDLHVDYSKLF